MKVKSLGRVRLFATPWSAAYQAPPSMGFSKQEYWSGVPLDPIKYTLPQKTFFFDHLFEVVSECVYINTNVHISIFIPIYIYTGDHGSTMMSSIPN